jgi:hypothetical protein
MQEKALDLAIKEFGNHMGIAGLELDLAGFAKLELESGEVFNLEQADEKLLVYLSVEVLPYIVARILENLYTMANYKTQGEMPFMVGLYQSNIIICMHLDINEVTGLQLIQAADKLWDLRKSAFH